MSDNIRVVIKVRPLIAREVESKLSYQWRVNNNTISQIDSFERGGHSYTFDKVYDKDTKTNDVYNDIAKPIVEAALAGFNGTIFAYGQTSSGKTYTMTGTEDAPGIIPLAVVNLFNCIKDIPDREFLVRVSYVEIYNETLVDLLDLKRPIKISETYTGVKVDATERLTTSPEEILKVMEEGKVNRQTGSTNMNDESSRSHSIFQITIESREHVEEGAEGGAAGGGSAHVSQLNLVDLAGSERAGQTGATGLRFKEGTHINRSLSALALVIKQLSEDPNPKHVNYRDSKLTRILQNSLGGNAKTGIVCAVTPASVDETISTLQFASRAKSIKNSPAVNVVATDATMIQDLTKQLSSLKTQLEGKKNVEQVNYYLKNKIARLQSLILNGFVQRSAADVHGGRRRVPARRVTISTLHPIEEDASPAAAKFSTPSFKYNSMTVHGTEVPSVHQTPSLSSVVEEPRLVTPPPDRKVSFSDEVIEIDSDDDSLLSQPCSPYHSCFESSKTPPCVLRKNAKVAEKNLKDIVELTEREKVFKPNVVELMEQLETKVSIITQMEEDLNRLKSTSNDKDSELEKLRRKISVAQQEISDVTSSKQKLEDNMKIYETKITDLEVSYEMLKNKARMREDELLSLLQHNTSDKSYESTGMNTSLVYAENNTNQENSLLSDIQAQLLLKEDTIAELEKRLSDHAETVNTLEKENREFLELLEIHKSNIDTLKKENSNQAATIGDLNIIIQDQKTLIDSINDDIKSYSAMVQDLQLTVSEKDKILKEVIVDFDIDGMLANEEIIAANNDNLKNIAQSLKLNIQNKKEELSQIKSKVEKSSLTDNVDFQNELENSRKMIKSLTEQIAELKIKHSSDVNQLFISNEKNNAILEEDLNKEISNILEKKKMLENEKEVYRMEILKLKELNDLQNVKIVGREQDIEHLKQQHELLNIRIMVLESDIENKSKQIIHLEEQHKNSESNLDKIRSFAKKIQEITFVLSGKTTGVPEIVDNLVTNFTAFSDNIHSLEDASAELLKQKSDMLALIEKQESEIEKYRLIINVYDRNVSEFCCECKKILEIKNYKEKDNDHALDCCENNELCLNNEENNGCDSLKYNFKNLLNLIKTIYMQKSQLIETKDIEIKQLLSAITNKDSKLKEVLTKFSELDSIVRKKDTILNNVLQKCSDITLEFSIENNGSSECGSASENTFENIILTLHKIYDYINIIKSSSNQVSTIGESCNFNDTIGAAKSKIVDLTKENLELLDTIHNLETEKNNLFQKFKEILIKSQDFALDLRKSKDLINSFKGDVESNLTEFKNGLSNFSEALKVYMKKIKTDNADRLFEISKTQSENALNCSNYIKNHNIHHNRNHPQKQRNAPPSLTTICCKTIIEVLDIGRESDTKTLCESSSVTSRVLENVYHNEQILSELECLRRDNTYLKSKNEELQTMNQNLQEEHKMLLKEVQLLIESSHDLQKKVVNHRTNLSTLMATTYAENKSLTSQIKFLQHYYSRFYNVCQKDIPDFKKQLQDLLVLLKSENIAKHNESFKRYSLPSTLDSTSTHSTFRNESILDGDLLMLDTNVSLTTCDNTLLGPNQTGLEVTQIYLCKEVACQTTEIVSNDTSLSQVVKEDPKNAEHQIIQKLETLKEENDKLFKLVEEYRCQENSESNTNSSTRQIVQLECIPEGDFECTHAKELNAVKIKLNEIESQEADFELKYSKLRPEALNIIAPTCEPNEFEKEMKTKQCYIDKLTSSLNDTKKEMEKLQEENDGLSNQVMDYVSEIDHLKEEQELLSKVKTELANKCNDLEKDLQLLHSSANKDQCIECLECKVKEQVIGDLKDRLATDPCTRLNRRYSDSESSSRYNKFCTLQNELHAGKEDCIELKEDVTTIKNHLEGGSPNHQAMDLDISMGKPHDLSFNATRNIVNNIILDTSKENLLDNYNLEKVDCFNYCMEKLEGFDSIFDPNMKIIDVLKMFYENLVLKHSNEVENQKNHLKNFEEGRQLLENQVASLNVEKTKIWNELNEKDEYLRLMAELMLSLKNNLNFMKDICNQSDLQINFKETFLHKIDKEFGLDSVTVFNTLLNFIRNEHCQETQRLEHEMQNVREELSSAKSMLAQRETEYNLLCQQKKKIHEVSNAVTLDIIAKDRELREIVKSAYKKISELNILENKILDFNLPLNEIVKLLFQYTFNYYNDTNISDTINQEKHMLLDELNNAKNILDKKEKELETLKKQKELVQADNEKNATSIITEVQQKLQHEINLHGDLKEIYEKKVEENASNVKIIVELTDVIEILKEDIHKKETTIKSLDKKLNDEAKLPEMLQSLKEAHEKIEALKILNEKIREEKDEINVELLNAGNTIAHNKVVLDNLNKDLTILRQSIKEYSDVIEKLKLETKSLVDIKAELHKQLQDKCNQCSQLQVNIKTHEKTAEIQSKMIIKTRKQKEEAERAARDKDALLEELSVKCKELQEQRDALVAQLATRAGAGRGAGEVPLASERLAGGGRGSEQVSSPPAEHDDSRRSSLADGVRRRRRSVLDARRMGHNAEDDRPPADLFMDVDGSPGDTPARSSGRESFSSKHDQSDDEAGWRVRSRRHSLLDQVRRLSTGQNNSHDSENSSANSEVQELRKQLCSCQKELTELHQRYRELDEECETCAQHLRDSEQQCSRLKRDRSLLEASVEELTKKLKEVVKECSSCTSKPEVSDKNVNTDDADWLSLHSLVVDRMSYDAALEKNKRLMRTVEELRHSRQQLRAGVDKMQRALDKHKDKDRKEMEALKTELEAYKQKLSEYKERCKELDEECETCAEYLRDRDEQCRKLKEAKASLEVAKAALETKLQEYECDSPVAQSVRKKRQSLHDRQRTESDARVVVDAATDTGLDLEDQAQKDSLQNKSIATLAQDNERLKTVVQRVSAQKADLEAQLAVISSIPAAPVFVATGSAIVQKQQITDVLKENQKLKKMNARLINMCKKRGKSADANTENEDPSEIKS